MPNENDEFTPEIRAAFAAYPRPVADRQFDANFWRELDKRQQRYRGLRGLLRRLIEVEIEGIAVWRLGLALFGGAATCALGVALLSLGASPETPVPSAPFVAEVERIPTAMPRYAREMWDERDFEIAACPPRDKPLQKPTSKEEISCVWFVRGLA